MLIRLVLDPVVQVSVAFCASDAAVYGRVVGGGHRSWMRLPDLRLQFGHSGSEYSHQSTSMGIKQGGCHEVGARGGTQLRIARNMS